MSATPHTVEASTLEVPGAPGLELTVLRKACGSLTKTIRSDGNGGIEKDASACAMAEGRARRVRLASLADLPDVLVGLAPSEAISLGVPDADEVHVVAREKLNTTPGAVSRTLEHFAWPARGLALFDHDPAPGQPPITSPDEFAALLARVDPQWVGVGYVATCSTSSAIYAGDRELAPPTGWHLFTECSDPAALRDYMVRLARRLWLAGRGFIAISRDGSLLVRQSIDASVASPERLIFEAGAVCAPGLEQRRPAPEYRAGPALDPHALPVLTDAEEAKYDRLVAQAKQAAAPEAATMRAVYIEIEGEKLAVERRIPKRDALRLVAARADGHLYDHDVLEFDRLGQVTVAEVLADLKRFDGETLADPAEPEYGRCKAKLFAKGKKGEPGARVHSFAHGARMYWLHADALPEPGDTHARAPTDPRPEVRIAAGETIALCRDLAHRLAEARAPLYRRGPLLMRATRVSGTEPDDEIRRQRDALILQRVTPAMLLGDVSTHVRLVKWAKREKDYVPADLPDRSARAFIELAAELGALPAVSGITECPIILSSGALVTRCGFDAATGLIFDGGATDWRALRVPAAPTATEVRAAVETLREPLRDFPFVSKTDEAVALSAMLTAAVRPQLPAAPLHGINATAPGTGKTLLANAIGIIATGRPVPAMAMGDSNEEFSKRIDSALLAADPVALIDNVSRPVSGDTACISLTSSHVRMRILGRTEQVELRSCTFWLATGNNLTFRGDMTRRVLLCTLDAGVERPDLREFERDLLVWVSANRLRLLSAIFTLLRGFIRAGSPKPAGLPPLGGFEAWTRRVRDALVWAELPDVLGSVENVRNDDPELQQRIAIFQAWHTVNGDEWRTVRDITHAVKRAEDATSASTAMDRAFAEELAGIGSGTRFDRTALQYWLRSNKGRIAGGLRLDAHLDRKSNVQTWQVSAAAGSIHRG